MVVRVKDKFFKEVSTELWDALVPEEVTEAESPRQRWLGGKITTGLWSEVLAFFEWSQEETKSETVVHLFYDRGAGAWAAAALPQKGYTGMSVSLLPDHPDWGPTLARLGESFEEMGTVHHHCSSSAFQSGVDHADEVTKAGLHVTVGHVGGGEYSLHARASFRKAVLPASLSDWFELPEFCSDLPEHLRDAVALHLLTRPRPGAAFPDWWKGNVVRVAAPAALFTGLGPCHAPVTWGHQGLPPSQVPGYQVRARPTLKGQLGELLGRHNLPAGEFAKMVEDLDDIDVVAELITAMVWTDTFHLGDVLACLEGIGGEEATRQAGGGDKPDVDYWAEVED